MSIYLRGNRSLEIDAQYYYNLFFEFFKWWGYKDTFFDLGNNEKGLNIGNKFKGNSQNGLFDYIFKTEIEPYRTPTLYGKIIND